MLYSTLLSFELGKIPKPKHSKQFCFRFKKAGYDKDNFGKDIISRLYSCAICTTIESLFHNKCNNHNIYYCDNIINNKASTMIAKSRRQTVGRSY
jgi:hypothetical protein